MLSTRTWDGSTSTSWQDPTNWKEGSAPVAGDDLVFPNSGVTNFTANNDLPSRTYNSIRFEGDGFTLTGNAITLGAGGLTDASLGAAANIVNLPMTLAGATRTITTADAGAVLRIGGAVSGSAVLIKQGAGDLQLNAANTGFTGAASVEQGVLSVGNSSALGSTAGATEVLAGATVAMRGSGIGVAEPISLNGGGVQGLGALRQTISGSWSGPVTLATDATIGVDAGRTLTISGPIGGSGNLTKVGPGRLILDRDNTYTGTTFLNAGTTQIQKALALGNSTAGTVVAAGAQLNVGGALTFGERLNLTGSGVGGGGVLQAIGGNSSHVGVIVVTGDTVIHVDAGRVFSAAVVGGSGKLIKDGPGELRLAGGISNSYTGGTLVKEGTLALAKTDFATAVVGPLTIGSAPTGPLDTDAGTVRLDAGHQIADNASVSVLARGTFNLNNQLDSIGPLAMTNGSITTGTGQLTLTGNATIDPSGSLTVPTIAGRLGLSGLRTFTVADSPLADDLVVSAVVSGGSGLQKAGAGTMVLSGANTYAGRTFINQGIVEAATATALGSDDSATTDRTVVEVGAALHLTTPASETFTEALELRGGTGPDGQGALVNVGSVARLWNAPIFLASPAGVGGGGTLTLVALGNSGSGAGGLVKLGTGRVVLSSAITNNYLGDTVVAAGTLELDKPAGTTAVPSGRLIIGSGGTGATVVLDAANQIANVVDVVVNPGSTLNLNGEAETIGDLTMASGTVASLVAPLTVLGDVAVDNGAGAGSIVLGNLALGATAVTFAIADGTAPTDLGIFGAVSGAGRLEKAGAGTLLLAGGTANTYNGGTTVLDGTLQLSKTAGVNAVPPAGAFVVGDGAGHGRVVLGANEQIANSDSVAVNAGSVLDAANRSETIGGITLTGGRVETGTGLLTFGSGSTVRSASSTQPSVINGRMGTQLSGVFFDVADGAAAEDLVINAVIEGSGGPAKRGAGTLALNADNTFGGTTAAFGVFEGTLLANGTHASVEYRVDTSPGARKTVLGGNGTARSLNVLNGILDAGTTPGQAGALNVSNGTLTFANTSGAFDASKALHVDLNGTVPGIGHDQINVLGSVNLGNGVTQLDVSAASFTPGTSDVFVIINNDGADAVAGQFIGLPQGGPVVVNGVTLFIDYAGGTGNDVTLSRQRPRSFGLRIADDALASVIDEGALAVAGLEDVGPIEANEPARDDAPIVMAPDPVGVRFTRLDEFGGPNRRVRIPLRP